MSRPEQPDLRLEEILMRYGDDLTESMPTRQGRSWTRLRASLGPSTAGGGSGRRGVWLALGAAVAAVAIIAVAFAFLQPVEAVVAAGRGEATALVGDRLVTLREGDRVPAGALVRTAAESWVALRIGDDTLSIDEKSEVVLSELSRFPRRIAVRQADGRTWNVLVPDPSRSYVVRTAGGDIAAQGTAFLVTARRAGNPEVVTAEGVVEIRAPAGSARVGAGQKAELTAAPPVAENVETKELSASESAAIVDALGRSCAAGASHLPGCLASAQKVFTLLPTLSGELKLQVRTPAATSLSVATAEVKKVIEVPGQGTFSVKLVLAGTGTTIKVDVDDSAKRVKEAKPGTPEAKREAELAAREANDGADKARRKAEEAAATAAAKAEEAARKAQEAQTTGSEQARRDAQKAAEEAREAAEKARKLASKAAEEAREAAEEAKEAQAEAAEKAAKEAEKAREDAEKAAEKAAKEAEKAKREAEKAAEKTKKEEEKKEEKAKDDAVKAAKEACEQAAKQQKEQAERSADAAKAAADRAREEERRAAEDAAKAAKEACKNASDKDACERRAEQAKDAVKDAADQKRDTARAAAERQKEAAKAAAERAKEECEREAERAKGSEASPKPSPGASPEAKPSPSPRPSPTPTGRP